MSAQARVSAPVALRGSPDSTKRAAARAADSAA
ncbi:hypothetical protein HD593_000241 [Nonomuraea rubra]|uniref:Uncharacterized protein n=1 Tax=Nonomuraea rubra TaxID=46180 RepID=A0A7X0TVJ9_9ACTN|nr:hypothetical protein [Nonomuraea rubra]